MQRRSLPGFQFAGELARQGKLGKLHTLYAHPGGLATKTSGWTRGRPEPPKEQLDWDLFSGTAAWRPFDTADLTASLRRAAGWSAAAAWNGVRTASTNASGQIAPMIPCRRNTIRLKTIGRRPCMPNGVKLVLRNDGWLPLGSCPVRYEGSDGWVEVGDSGQFALSSPTLLAGRKVEIVPNYPATPHVRNFLDCVKTRAATRVTAQVACNTHIACHAVNIAMYLNRKLTYDPKKNEFVGDDEANRFRGEGAGAVAVLNGWERVFRFVSWVRWSPSS